MFLDSFLFSINVTLPTVLMLLLGIFLRQIKMIDDHFCQIASKLIFNIALPALLFTNIVKNPADYSSQIWLLSAGFLTTLILYFSAEWIATRYIIARSYRGIFVQAIFRGNSGILGLALCINAYGASSIVPASVYTASITLLFNVLAVITLTKSLSTKPLNFSQLFLSIIKNPLCIGIALGLFVSKLTITIPEPLMKTADYLAHISLPVALICAGASLNFKQLKQFQQQENHSSQTHRIMWWASFGRLIISPLFAIIIGKFVFSLEPMLLGILFLMSSTPIAAASYAMVRNFGGDAVASANLIAITVIGSMLSSSIGLFILRQLQWI